MKKKIHFTALLAGLSSLAMATPIQLNFGATVNDADTNTPGQVIGGISGTSWNLITGDTASGIVDANGNATSVTVNIGKSSGAADNTQRELMDWTRNGVVNSGLGTASSTGIYTGNSRSAMFVDDGSSSNIRLGTRISGLTANTYDVYVVSRNTNAAAGRAFTLFQGVIDASVGNTTPTGTADGFTATTLVNGNGTDTSWDPGINYQHFQVTLASNEDLVMVIRGDSGGENRGFLNSIQITPIPEPSTGLMILGAFGLMAVLRTLPRRR